MITSQPCECCGKSDVITFPFSDSWRCPYCYYDIPSHVLQPLVFDCPQVNPDLKAKLMSVEDNIIARSTAKDLIELFDFPNSPLVAEMLIDELQRIYPQLKPKLPEQEKPLTELQIATIRQMRFAYGQFQGYHVYQVPKWYIDSWLDAKEFTNMLRRYSQTEQYKNFHIEN